MSIKNKYMLISCIVLSLVGIINTVLLFIFGYIGSDSDTVYTFSFLYAMCFLVFFVMIMINTSKSIMLIKKYNVNLVDLTNKIKEDKKGKKYNRISAILGIVSIIYIIIISVITYEGYIDNLIVGLGAILFIFVLIAWSLYFANIITEMQYKIIKKDYVNEEINIKDE